MDFYLLKLDRCPEIRHAHGYRTQNYSTSLLYNPNTVEAVYIESGRMLRERDGGETVYDQGGVAVFSRGADGGAVRLRSDAPVHHHFSVGLTLSRPAAQISAAEVLAWKPCEREAVLPEYVGPQSNTEAPERLIKEIIRAKASIDAGRFLQSASLIYGLFACLTEAALACASSLMHENYSRENVYCRRAVSYITEHLSEKIYVRDVAEYAGVSYGYLSNLFYAARGMTLVDFINFTKLQHLKEIITTCDATLESAGAAVGISDGKYLSRLFKKYNGMTAGEYKALHNNALR